jgi:hypothetical protein
MGRVRTGRVVGPRPRGTLRPVALVLAGTLALGGLLAACGGGDPTRLSKATYVRRANTECDMLKQASDDLAQAQSAGATGEQVRRYLNQAANSLADLAEGLDGLTPPAAMEGDADDLGSALADYGDGLRTLAGRVGANQTFTDTLGANQGIVRKLNRLAERATRLVATLGIDGCQLAA